MDQILSLPFGVAWAVLFVIVLARTNATYWLGRGIAAGAARSTRIAERLERPASVRRIARAQRLLDRWDPFAIVLTFLTVGLQTAVNLAAGLGRMHLRYYIPATAVGSVVWAFLYATVGLAAFDLWFEHASASPWLWVIVGTAVLVAVVRVALVRRTRRRAVTHDGGGAASVDGVARGGADQERSGT